MSEKDQLNIGAEETDQSGADGAAGTSGADGAYGANGADGASGTDGADGADGPHGLLAVQERKLTLEMTKDCPTTSLYGTLR